VKAVRRDILMTAMAVAQWTKTEPLLEITLHTWEFLSLFRIDLSDACAIITTPDGRTSAMRYDRASEIYPKFQQEINLSRQLSKELSLDTNPLSNPRRFFEAAGLNVADFSDDELSAIRSSVHSEATQKNVLARTLGIGT
jgi:hypothetical protein